MIGSDNARYMFLPSTPCHSEDDGISGQSFDARKWDLDKAREVQRYRKCECSVLMDGKMFRGVVFTVNLWGVMLLEVK